MPNFCENDLTVEGPKDVVLQFLKFAAGESSFDFNRFIPYPDEFQQLDDAAKAWDEEHAKRPADYDWRARPTDGFNAGGYEWRITNWGTKWPASRVKMEWPTCYGTKTLAVVLHFDTAWSPPKPIIENAAKRYPALTFDLRYFDCGCRFNGIFRCVQGEVDEDASGEYFGTRGG